MKKIVLIIFFMPFFTSINLFSQNLVPNPSFEDYDTCYITSFKNGIGWNSYANTPDYFNKCSTNPNYSIPFNGWGTQSPLTTNCNAYAGFWAYSGTLSLNGREIFGTQLIDSLIIGQTFYLSFKISLAEESNCGVNKLGIRFSTIDYGQDSIPIFINNYSTFYSSTIITDTINWVKISGSFIADSSYKYLYFGNFFDDYSVPHS